jgi:signal peptidase I
LYLFFLVLGVSSGTAFLVFYASPYLAPFPSGSKLGFLVHSPKEWKEGDLVVVQGAENSVWLGRILTKENHSVSWKQGEFYVDGKLYQNPLPKPPKLASIPSEKSPRDEGSLQKVPAGEYFVMGLEWEGVWDSRFLGSISSKQLLGKFLPWKKE